MSNDIDVDGTYGIEVEIPSGAKILSLKFRRGPEPEPEPPAWHKCPWKSNGVPGGFHANYFNATQRWSVFGIPDDIQAPYGAEVKTAFKEFQIDSTGVIAFGPLAKALGALSIPPTWLLVDAERPRTKHTWQIVDWLRENHPEIQLGGGPIPWTGPLPDDLKRFDFTVTFRNFGCNLPRYWGRMGEDALRWQMRSRALGIPYSMFPQPVVKYRSNDGSTKIGLVDIEDYGIALDICCRSPWGLFMWGVPELCGLRETDPDGVAAIMAAWDAAEHDTEERPVVYIAQQKDWRVETMLCAIAHHAGYDVEYHPTRPFSQEAGGDWYFYPTGGGEGIVLDFPRPVIDGTEYPLWRLFLAWFDTGYPLREKYANAFLKKTMRDYERALGDQLRERLR